MIRVSSYLLTGTSVGQDNDSKECTTGDVPSIFSGDENEHDGESFKSYPFNVGYKYLATFDAGPYDGVEMGC